MDWYHPTLGRLSSDAPFTLDGMQYTQGLRTMPDAERTALGFIPTDPPGPKPDERYYWVERHENGPATTYTGTPKALDQLKALRLADLAAKRYAVEVGGCVLNGIVVPTDREGRKNLRDARDALAEGILTSVDFKAASGWLTVTQAAQVAPLVVASAQHVQQAFSNERAHGEAIEALTDPEAVIAYDITTDWPSNPPPAGA